MEETIIVKDPKALKRERVEKIVYVVGVTTFITLLDVAILTLFL